VDRWAEGEGKGGVKGLSSRAEVREKLGGGCGFSSLMKQKKKAKICFVIYIAGFFLKKKFCYEVIVKQIFKERPANHYLPPYTHWVHPLPSCAGRVVRRV
jgi:hypothetical protein